MSSIYLDTSAFLAVLFSELKSREIIHIMGDSKPVFSSCLLEAEARAAGVRRGLPVAEVDEALGQLSLFQPDRSITPELKNVLSVSPILKGADLWHVACALYLAGDPSNLPFVTLDDAQAEAASRLGFKVLPGGVPGGSGVCEAPAVYRVKRPKTRRR